MAVALPSGTQWNIFARLCLMGQAVPREVAWSARSGHRGGPRGSDVPRAGRGTH